MAINFRKQIRLHKLLNLNVNKGGLGVSFGIPGARIALNTKGNSRLTLGIPKSGLSYTKSLNLKNKTKQAQNAEKSSNKQNVQAHIDNYQSLLFSLTHLHTQANDFIDFTTNPIQYQTNELGPKQRAAMLALENYQPSFLDKLFNRTEKKQQQLLANLQQAIAEDEEDKPIHTLSEKETLALQNKEAMAMDHFIAAIGGFKIFDDDTIRYSYEFMSGINQIEAIKVDVVVDFNEAVFDRHYDILPSGNLSNRKLAKADYNERTFAYTCSLILGIATQANAITPLTKAIVNIHLQESNTNTGYQTTYPIMAGIFDEADLLPLDYESLNPMEVIKNLPVIYDFTKTNGFKEISPIIKL